MSELFLLLLLIGIGWFWLDGARAREMGTELAKAVCQRQQLQFLDGTVVLRRVSLCHGQEGKRVLRIFTYDYTDGDEIRRQGYIRICGRLVEDVSLGIYVPDES